MGHLEDFVDELDFGVHKEDITSKALENIRLMDLKVTNLKKAENARIPLAIEFACKSLHITAPRPALVHRAGISNKEYIEAFQKCINLMGFKFENLNTITVFGVKYSSSDTATDAHTLLEAYARQQKAKGNTYQQPAGDYGSALYHGAAFIVAAKMNKVKAMPKRDHFFLTLDLPNKDLFMKVCAAMEVRVHTVYII
jgi:hypothetical protein